MCATGDADVMVSRDYTNAQFASDYLSVYDQNPEVYESVYEALLGKQGFDVFDDYAANSENAVFIGADKKYSGIDTPDFDIVRYLNSKDIDNISYDTVNVNGIPINVASLHDLADMKRQTIQLLRVPPSESSRLQDFDDLRTLETLLSDVDRRTIDDMDIS